jgi:glycerophosphoryl diester phosphodiesterase
MFSWREPRSRPLVVAHRGSSSLAPENTLASFRQAIDDGADAVELDVRLTKDGHAVVIHDRELRRTTGTRGRVDDHALREIRALSAGAWFHRKFAAERIPTLDEVFELAAGRCGVNVEIKVDRGDPGGEETVDRCCRIIRAHRAGEWTLVTSFSNRAVKRAGSILPGIPTGLLLHPLRHLMKPPVGLTRSLGALYLIVNGSGLRRKFVRAAHERNILVGEYTVNSHRRIERARRFGIDALITDEPSKISSSLP